MQTIVQSSWRRPLRAGTLVGTLAFCATLALALGATLALGACSGSDAGASASSRGAELFKVQACVTCHGNEGQGSMLGPALRGLKQHWTRAQLVEYLNDPQAFTAKDPRLAKQGKGFIQSMPGYKLLKPEERESLADFVLAWP